VPRMQRMVPKRPIFLFLKTNRAMYMAEDNR